MFLCPRCADCVGSAWAHDASPSYKAAIYLVLIVLLIPYIRCNAPRLLPPTRTIIKYLINYFKCKFDGSEGLVV